MEGVFDDVLLLDTQNSTPFELEIAEAVRRRVERMMDVGSIEGIARQLEIEPIALTTMVLDGDPWRIVTALRIAYMLNFKELRTFIAALKE